MQQKQYKVIGISTESSYVMKNHGKIRIYF